MRSLHSAWCSPSGKFIIISCGILLMRRSGNWGRWSRLLWGTLKVNGSAWVNAARLPLQTHRGKQRQGVAQIKTAEDILGLPDCTFLENRLLVRCYGQSILPRRRKVDPWNRLCSWCLFQRRNCLPGECIYTFYTVLSAETVEQRWNYASILTGAASVRVLFYKAAWGHTIHFKNVRTCVKEQGEHREWRTGYLYL